MNIAGNTILKSLQKRQEAMLKHVARQEAFQMRKKQMINDIEEARTIWIETLKQLPKKEFDSQFRYNQSNKITHRS
jgi:type II secretory pathway component PulJ